MANEYLCTPGLIFEVVFALVAALQAAVGRDIVFSEILRPRSGLLRLALARPETVTQDCRHQPYTAPHICTCQLRDYY